MVPPQFPLLFVFPGIAIDLLIRRFGNGRDWTLSIALGIAFVLVMVAAHWFWGDFLISPAARNWFFAADKWDYNSRLGPWRYQFWNLDRDASKNFSPVLFLRGITIAIVYAVIGSRIGLWWGKGYGPRETVIPSKPKLLGRNLGFGSIVRRSVRARRQPGRMVRGKCRSVQSHRAGSACREWFPASRRFLCACPTTVRSG
jgi:hypothetical protein